MSGLFDCTPRMNKAKENNVSVMDVADRGIAQNDSRSILRRGTAEGYSEVDFVALTGEVFRSRWTVRRSRGKVSGSLQKVEMTLTNLTSGVEQQGTKTELLSRISELIGLSFEQFNRSVLLAQGDFATFLKARQPDKAEILEKLTGTELYTAVARKIYEFYKEAEAAYNEVFNQVKAFAVHQLSDEKLAEVETRKGELDASFRTLQAELQKLKDQQKWYADLCALEVALLVRKQNGNRLRKRHRTCSRYGTSCGCSMRWLLYAMYIRLT